MADSENNQTIPTAEAVLVTGTPTVTTPQEQGTTCTSDVALPTEQANMVHNWLETMEKQRRCSKRKRVDDDTGATRTRRSATSSPIMSTSASTSMYSGDHLNNETDVEEDEEDVASPILQDVVSIHREESQAEDLLSHFCSKSNTKSTQCSDDDYDDDEISNKNKKMSGLRAWTAEKWKSGENEARWMTKFELLKQYKAKHGDCLVRKRDKTLGQWVYDQRKHYRLLKEGKKAKISQDRIDMLESIGFAWSSMSKHFVKYDKLWMSKFEEFKRFMEVKQNAFQQIVPEKGTQLCKWIENQRYQYIGFQKGKQSRLTQERVNLLNSVGFIWRKEYTDDTTCTTAATAL
mmetsp:Transcript_16268/g.23964  ORF Transcript_16268/g.23964 Transcript_16268/m.23964 type:complete len:347 (-) Transcript_16268:82-1122(-)|eukprot:CAMPEP_0116027274 /NCGR_PEP_ID=MMETSP0321-20121206/14517_1 /TAXON_ID=163516 /ORGANISM="Leptocylindrus danicus var. danicus, Strain B650" /LENGTH=346 /DNA_ID=CAMNT_0003500569 /DNA_START=123 /DNA_END=1166 /DNA_ORIENTATION=+